jgi:hypothetical protein
MTRPKLASLHYQIKSGGRNRRGLIIEAWTSRVEPSPLSLSHVRHIVLSRIVASTRPYSAIVLGRTKASRQP